jgi:hypothetical protein
VRNSFLHIAIFFLTFFTCNNFIQGTSNQKWNFENEISSKGSSTLSSKQNELLFLIKESDPVSFTLEDNSDDKNSFKALFNNVAFASQYFKSHPIFDLTSDFPATPFTPLIKQFILTFALRV